MAGRGTRYEPRRRGFQEAAVGPEARAAVTEVAVIAQGVAEGLAAEFADTGNYAGSFEIHQDTITDPVGQYPHRRAAAVLENTAGYALIVEIGHEDPTTGRAVEGHHVLGRTLDIISEAT